MTPEAMLAIAAVGAVAVIIGWPVLRHIVWVHKWKASRPWPELDAGTFEEHCREIRAASERRRRFFEEEKTAWWGGRNR